MVSFRHFGRCANFHYQAACAYGYAKKHGLEFSVPDWTSNNFWHPLYLQHLVHLNYDRREDILLNENWNVEKHFNEYEFNEDWRNLNIVFNGFNQSYKYFDFCREEMLNDFGYSYIFNKDFCGLHCRRGDYVNAPHLHPVITHEYLEKAINYIIENTGVKKFIVFSDGMDWCKQNIDREIFPQCEEIFYSENKNELDDLISLSHCEHIICSNSSFSLFASELNRNENKVVVVPSEQNWFGEIYAAKMIIKDMYRNEWIKISYKPIYELA